MGFRQSHDMVNDDCTLVAFKVAAAKAPRIAAAAAAESVERESTAAAEPTGTFTPVREGEIETGEHQALPDATVAKHGTHEANASEPPAANTTPGETGGDHPGVQENGTVPPNPESEQPMARDGFPESTDNTAV